MAELWFTEEDHRRIDEIVAKHDPTGWLMTTRIRLFSEEDADWYANLVRPGLRGAVVAALIAGALGDAIRELGGTFSSWELYQIEGSVREMFEHEPHLDQDSSQRRRRVLEGTSDDQTDEDQSQHFDAVRVAIREPA